ncbi:MAG: hypothetical protein JO197_23555 [Acidobacteria bacterium]|nr:hypothetical protein [Acidobacteriota bacterium]MBV9477814.1 hypothetical protein [Acidobacteriota bacterium]
MNYRNLITAAALSLLPLAAQAATIVVPAAGTGPGANNSQWQSELTLHTSGPRAVTLSLAFHTGTDVRGPVEVTLQPRETVSIADIAKTRFGLSSATGAIVITVDDKSAKSVAVTSRTFNTSPAGEFGQDIPAVDVANASGAGDIAALTGPSNAAITRFNFGVYAVNAASVTWEVVRANGTVATSKDVTYAAGEHVQYNSGIASLLGVQEQNNDTVQARVTSGNAIFYGSAINNNTGDPSFVPSVRTRDDVNILFAGVDLDENGTVDVADANGDGVLDAPIAISTLAFPQYFRVVAAGEFGENVTLEIVSIDEPAAATLLDANGTVRVGAPGELKGRTGELVVRATSDFATTLLRIPVRYQ